MSIHLIIIGAGLAGLSAAISTKIANPDHQVTILESVKELAEIGVSLSPSTYLWLIITNSFLGWITTHTKCNSALRPMGNLRPARPQSYFPQISPRAAF
jgi:flavin-dependent dehydrogenase